MSVTCESVAGDLRAVVCRTVRRAVLAGCHVPDSYSLEELWNKLLWYPLEGATISSVAELDKVVESAAEQPRALQAIRPPQEEPRVIWRNLQYVPGLLRVDSFGAQAAKAKVSRSVWDTVMVHVGEPVCAALEGPEVAVQAQARAVWAKP